MPATLTIKNVSDDVVRRLEERASRYHRSLQGELMAILEQVVRPSEHLTPDQVLGEIRHLGLSTPREAVAMIREDRGDR